MEHTQISFIAIFFVMVGVGFDLSALLDSGPVLALVSLLAVTAYMVKVLSAMLFRLVYTWRESFAAGKRNGKYRMDPII